MQNWLFGTQSYRLVQRFCFRGKIEEMQEAASLPKMSPDWSLGFGIKFLSSSCLYILLLDLFCPSVAAGNKITLSKKNVDV